MSSLSSSQRSFPFSVGDRAMLNETQGALETQAKPQSSSWATSQEVSKRDPWRCWNLWTTKFAYDNPCWEEDRFKLRSPRSECWCWPVTREKWSRTTANGKWNILSSRNIAVVWKISLNRTWVINSCCKLNKLIIKRAGFSCQSNCQLHKRTTLKNDYNLELLNLSQRFMGLPGGIGDKGSKTVHRSIPVFFICILFFAHAIEFSLASYSNRGPTRKAFICTLIRFTRMFISLIEINFTFRQWFWLLMSNFLGSDFVIKAHEVSTEPR